MAAKLLSLKMISEEMTRTVHRSIITENKVIVCDLSAEMF